MLKSSEQEKFDPIQIMNFKDCSEVGLADPTIFMIVFCK